MEKLLMLYSEFDALFKQSNLPSKSAKHVDENILLKFYEDVTRSVWTNRSSGSSMHIWKSHSTMRPLLLIY